MLKKWIREPLVYLFLVLVLGWIALIPAKTEIKNVVLEFNGHSRPVAFPVEHPNMSRGEFLVHFDLVLGVGASTQFNWVPDDCLRRLVVNGQNVDLQGVKGLCDYAKGVVVDLEPYLLKGSNRVECYMYNNGGAAGLRMGPALKGVSQWSWLSVLWGLVFMVTLAMLLRKFKLGFWPIGVILVGVMVRFAFLAYTGPFDKTHDVDGHLEYIQILAQQKQLPGERDCWSCYHPPLYYVASAPLFLMGQSMDPAWTPRLLQQAQWMASVVAMVLGVALLFQLLGNGALGVLAGLLWVLWPGFVITAPRIGNDVPFYLGQMLCLFFAQRWWLQARSSDMLWATLGAALALASKSTGMVTLGVWGLVYILGCLRRLRLDSWKLILVSLAMVALAAGTAHSRALWNWWQGGEFALVGNVQNLHSGLLVENQIGNYLYFDLKDYLTVPYTDPWADRGGRQYFWNYFLKSSLFGEFRLWNTPLGLGLAGGLSFLSLVLVVLAAWGALHVRGVDFPLLLLGLAMIAAMVYLRAQYPYSCGNDFRYVAPLVLPWSYFAVRGARCIAHARLRFVSYMSLLAFALLSFVFMVLPAVF